MAKEVDFENTSIYQQIGPDTRVSLSQRVAKQLIQLIADRDLKAGDSLPSQETLCRLFGVSRTAIREGLQVLSGLGVVRIQQGVRVQVIEADPAALTTLLGLSAGSGKKAIENLVSVREILEPEIAALAARRASRTQVAKMAEAVAVMDDPGSNEEYVEADQAFHACLAEATGNDLLPRIMLPIMSLLKEMRSMAVSVEGACRRAQECHRAILERVEKGDVDGAREQMKAHLVQIRNDLDLAEKDHEESVGHEGSNI